MRAELYGDDLCTAEGHRVQAYAPVLAMCRLLIKHGVDPSTPLEVYRGPTPALHVRTIGEGARLAVGDGEFGRPRFRLYIPRRAGAPPIA